MGLSLDAQDVETTINETHFSAARKRRLLQYRAARDANFSGLCAIRAIWQRRALLPSLALTFCAPAK